MQMTEMTLDEIDMVQGGISKAALGDIGKAALAGGAAGFVVTAGNPVGFLCGAAAGTALAAAYHLWFAR